MKRTSFGIMKAWREGIQMDEDNLTDNHEHAPDFLDTVNAGIRLFLDNKSRSMIIALNGQTFRRSVHNQHVSLINAHRSRIMPLEKGAADNALL